MFPLQKIWLGCLALLTIGVADLSSAQNQNKQAKATAESWLPQKADRWLNAPPITGEMVKGKAVFVWFFEESSPRATDKWTKLNQIASAHVKSPILFIATSGGNSRERMANYIAKNQVAWPIVVDPKRQFELHIGKRATTVENLTGLKLIMPDGKIANGNPNKLEESIQKAIKDAEWEINAELVADAHVMAWRSVEFGIYSGAAGIDKDLKARDPKKRKSAQLIYDVVVERMNEACEKAAALKADKTAFDAYIGFHEVLTKFDGFELPDKYQAMIQSLEDDPEIKNEIKAYQQLLQTMNLLANPTPRTQSQVKSRLENLIKRYSNTRAAQEAATWLEENK